MAYEKIHESIDFKNRQAPSITADVLNRREATFEELDNRTVELSIFNESVPKTYATKAEVEEVSQTVGEIATEVSKGKADVILSNASGESIHSTDSTDSKAVEFALHGKATQKQYAGRNLLENKGTNQTIAGVTYNKNDDGSVTLNGTCEYGTYQYVVNDDDMSKLPNGTYKAYGFANVKGKAVWLRLVMSDGSSLYIGANEVREITITDDYKISRVRIHVNASAVLENYTISAMLCESTEIDTTYEPYVGGKPSPRPDYPQDIEVVGASGSVAVKSLGKNLIPYPYYETNHTDNGIEWTDLGDGRLKANGTASANSDYFMVSYNAMITLKAGTYIVNGCTNGGGESTHSIIVGKKVNGTLTRIVLANESGATFTLEEDTEIYVACRVSVGQTVSNLIFEPMISLEGGEFEPYKESTTTITTEGGFPGIPVSSGGNYTDASGQQWVTDEIVKYADGSGQYIQRIGHKTYNGSESIWRRVANETYSTVFYGDNSLLNMIGNRDCLCNRFRDTTLPIAQVTSGYTYYNLNSDMIYFAYGENSEENTLEGWKEFLSNNNLEFYYVLAEPIITDLSAEQIAELEVQMFYPTTNILNDAGCGMEVTYKADTKNYIDKIIGDRISALETALVNNI